MKATFKVVAAAAVMACAVSAQAQVKFDANMEYDITKVTDQSLDNGGRVELNVAGRAENGDAFVAAKGTVLIKSSAGASTVDVKDSSGKVVGSYTDSGNHVGVDDAWVQFGTKMVNAKIGRFEAMDLFPVGKDTVLETAASAGYRANKLRGRVDTSDGLHLALGITPNANTTIELGVLRGKDDGDAQGLRPAVSVGMGDITLRVGAERFETKGGDDAETGFAIGAGFKLAGGDMNATFAKSEDNSSIGVNGTFGNFGIGFVHDKSDDVKVNTVYTAYSIPFMGVKGASITPALSYSKPNEGDAVTAVRLRLRYDF